MYKTLVRIESHAPDLQGANVAVQNADRDAWNPEVHGVTLDVLAVSRHAVAFLLQHEVVFRGAITRNHLDAFGSVVLGDPSHHRDKARVHLRGVVGEVIPQKKVKTSCFKSFGKQGQRLFRPKVKDVGDWPNRLMRFRRGRLSQGDGRPYPTPFS